MVNIKKHTMAQQKATSPYFKSVHSPPSSPTVIATSMPFSFRYPPKHFIDSSKMVNFAKLDTKALIEAATASSTAQLKQPSPYALEAPQSLKASSCKRPRNSAQKDQSNDSTFASDSSEATPLAMPSKKKQKELLDDEDEECSMSPHPLRNTGKIHTSFLKLLESDEDGDIASKLPQSTNSRPTTSLRKPSSSSRKPAMPTKRRKSLGTPVPSSLESAHPADQELFKMKADGKPWKEIKVVWESLMNKKIGDSTLSVRYCKMKENFQKFGAKDVSSLSLGANGASTSSWLCFCTRLQESFHHLSWPRVLPWCTIMLTCTHAIGHAYSEIQGKSRIRA